VGAGEIECRVLLILHYTNLTPALAASLRHTTTAERQNRVVALRKVNILAAAQTDRPLGGASRTAGVIELPFIAFARRVLQLFHLGLVWNGSPHFPRAGVPLLETNDASFFTSRPGALGLGDCELRVQPAVPHRKG
jgi:hypothetical protein